jgi:hypothetical protein
MVALPGKKHLVPLIKIKVVKQAKSLIQGGMWSRHIGGEPGAKQAYEADNAAQSRAPYLCLVRPQIASPRNRCIVPVFEPQRNLLKPGPSA